MDYERFLNRYFKNSSDENLAKIAEVSSKNLEEIVLISSSQVPFKKECFEKIVGLYE